MTLILGRTGISSLLHSLIIFSSHYRSDLYQGVNTGSFSLSNTAAFVRIGVVFFPILPNHLGYIVGGETETRLEKKLLLHRKGSLCFDVCFWMEINQQVVTSAYIPYTAKCYNCIVFISINLCSSYTTVFPILWNRI